MLKSRKNRRHGSFSPQKFRLGSPIDLLTPSSTQQWTHFEQFNSFSVNLCKSLTISFKINNRSGWSLTSLTIFQYRDSH